MEIKQKIDRKGRLMEYKYDTMFYEGKSNYHIERRINNGKWKLQFGLSSYEEAKRYLQDVDSIEAQNKYYRIIGICIAVFMAISIIVFSFRF